MKAAQKCRLNKYSVPLCETGEKQNDDDNNDEDDGDGDNQDENDNDDNDDENNKVMYIKLIETTAQRISSVAVSTTKLLLSTYLA